MTVTPLWIDAILGLVLVESIALRLLLPRRTAAALLAPTLLQLAAGAGLLLALRAALAGAPGAWIAAPLAASGLSHAAGLLALRRLPLTTAPGGSGRRAA